MGRPQPKRTRGATNPRGDGGGGGGPWCEGLVIGPHFAPCGSGEKRACCLLSGGGVGGVGDEGWACPVVANRANWMLGPHGGPPTRQAAMRSKLTQVWRATALVQSVACRVLL